MVPGISSPIASKKSLAPTGSEETTGEPGLLLSYDYNKMSLHHPLGWYQRSSSVESALSLSSNSNKAISTAGSVETKWEAGNPSHPVTKYHLPHFKCQ